jgi:hypothetical protein
MLTRKEPISREGSQYRVILALSLAVAGVAAILQSWDPLLLPRFIGPTHPLIAFPLISALGVGLLSLLHTRGWFAICRRKRLEGLWRPCALAALLALITIVVDLQVPFPADLNVLFPKSLLFYPAIGFLVEVVFHVLPLAVLLTAVTAIHRNLGREKATVICILFVSLLEPVYQTLPMAASPHYPVWTVAVVGLNLTLFNLLQLFVFQRYDFIAMYSVRLVYYLLWHVVWGHLRLEVGACRRGISPGSARSSRESSLRSDRQRARGIPTGSV